MNRVSSRRIVSIDLLRGLVMVLMTLDHTRDFFSAAHFKPTDLDQTSWALFLTRWITHYCAPIFVFLAGSSAYLWQARRGSGAPISRYLAERGLVLLLLTTTVEAWAWNFRNDFQQIDGGVLWAIAWSMLALALLCKLPRTGLLMLGLLIIAGHNAFDGLKPEQLGAFGPWWAVLHTGDDVILGYGWSINPYYPLLPWIGVMALGYGFGDWLASDPTNRRQQLYRLGLALVAAFIALRWSNRYGDPKLWQSYPDPIFTLLSFLNCHKYPPSLLYLLMTLGPMFLLLAAFESPALLRLSFLTVFGRTPLFFYLLHLYLIHVLAIGVAALTGGPVEPLLGGGIWSKAIPADYGYGLPAVYGFWLLILLMLYPLCVAFERLKHAKPHWRWLKYF